MSIFEESSVIVRAVEAHLVQENYGNIPILGEVKRLIWLPAKFLTLGIKEKLGGATVWAFLSFAFIMLGAWFINASGIANTPISHGILLASMIIPLFLTTFPMPSLYGDSGVTLNTVAFVVEHLKSRHFTLTKEIELLQESVKRFEDRCRSRINSLKWLVGLLWAVFTYTYTKGNEEVFANPNDLMSFALTTAILLFGVIAAYLCVWGYDAAVDQLFRAIEFGCNDFRHNLESSKRIENPILD